MYIGTLKLGEPKFYLANTSVEHAPETDSVGYVWKWGNLFDCAVDIKYELERECYIGSVDLGLSSLDEVAVIVDGIKVAVRDQSKPVYVNLSGKEITIRARGNFKDLTSVNGDVEFIGKLFGDFCSSAGVFAFNSYVFDLHGVTSVLLFDNLKLITWFLRIFQPRRVSKTIIRQNPARRE